jgi:hypothetical protein
MDQLPPPLAFFLLLFSGWVNRHQQAVIEYLLEENGVLRVVNGSRRLRLTDDQRRRLAVNGPGPRPSSPRGRRGHRNTRHYPALVPETRRSEVR